MLSIFIPLHITRIYSEFSSIITREKIQYATVLQNLDIWFWVVQQKCYISYEIISVYHITVLEYCHYVNIHSPELLEQFVCILRNHVEIKLWSSTLQVLSFITPSSTRLHCTITCLCFSYTFSIWYLNYYVFVRWHLERELSPWWHSKLKRTYSCVCCLWCFDNNR